MMRSVVVCALALAFAQLTIQLAAGAVTIGQLPGGPPAPTCSGAETDYLQPSVTSGGLYIAKEAGTITSWSTVASAGANQHYTLKVFRRTSDPDAFRVVAHSNQETLSSGGGLNTFAASIPVGSGDLLGLSVNASGSTGCVFSVAGDTVLARAGSLADGAQGVFAAMSNSRLNLAAVLVPSNGFTLGHVTRDQKRGIATVTATLSNPGTIVMFGSGLKGDRTKTLFVAGPLTFNIATTGRLKRQLARHGRVTVRPTFTFTPPGGDPSSQSIKLKLKRRRIPLS
jgi:hypothetical protein